MIFVLTLALLLPSSWGLPRDLVIKFERSVLTNGTVVERIVVDGAFDSSMGQHPVVRSTKDEALRMIVERDRATANNCTYMRLRECNLRGYEVLRLSDRFQMNGRDYLVLEPQADSWTVLVPEANDLKKTWALETDLTRLEKTQLKEDCKEFVKQIDDKQNQEELEVLRVIAPVFTTAVFLGFVFTSILMFKRQGQHPGGVIGSIIHYPAHHHDVPLFGQKSSTGAEIKQQVTPMLKGLFQQS
nr:uncharacterized protein LOC129442424 [Misgurnus anguillicaudatus]XP_055058481.1 uncharacterized protein LOC129442439 [Misgurnus anguillicaudatus]